MNTVFYLVALLVDLAIKRQVTADQAKTDYTSSINSRRSKLLLVDGISSFTT